MKRRFTILTAALALLAFLAIPMGMRGQTRESYNVTYGYSDLGDMLYGSYLDASSYWKVPETSGNSAVISLPITNQPESDITVTFRIATFGSGTNPSASNTTISAVGTESNSNWNGSGVSSYPSSSTYVNGVMTITKPQNPTTLGGLDITMSVNTGVKIFRLQSVTVSYTYGGGTPQPTTYTVTYNCNGGTSGCPENVTGIEAGDEITLANAPTRTDYDFTGWSDGSATYNAGASYTVNGNVTMTAQWTEVVSGDEHWVFTNLADLTSSDVFVIVGNGYAMTNNNGTGSAPAISAVTITGSEITSTVAANIKWTVSGDATNGYTFYPNGSTSTWLYCNTTANSSSNNNMRVGTGNRKVFVLNSSNYLVTNDNYVARYLSIYNNADWRGYINTDLCPVMSFYKKVTGDILPPSITANNVSIAYDATSGEIEYTLNNPAANGSLSVSDNVDWISNAAVNTTESKVTFTTTANEATTAREGIITITYTYNRETISKDVTVTQAAAPVIYTTIPALFAAATGTETSVLVTFNNWVVSGVSSNGKNVFVTDNNGNGFVIYYTTDMSSTFAAGNILSGTAVSCTLKKYNGFAELLNVTATDLTITSGGTVTVADVALADLAGVNTGALLHYDNLTCVLTTNSAGTTTFYNLTDGTTTIQVYNAIYAFGTLVEGKTYNITGIYQQYNNTKEILPRSAEDIVEVEVQHEEYTLTVSNLSHVNLFIFGGDESESIINTEEGQSAAQVYDGTSVEISVDVESGYVLQSLVVDGTDVTNQIDGQTGMYVFTMPAHNVTITATAEVLTGDNYELYSGALVEGDYLIVYNGKAMNNIVSSNRLQYEEVIAYNDVITTDNAEIVWHIAPSGDYWTIFSADANAYAASTGTKNQATTMTDGTDDKALWTVSGNYDFVNKYNSANNINSYLRNNGTYGFACYATGTGGALSLYKKVEDTPVIETFTKPITGYNQGGGWNLIASPLAADINPENVDGMTTNNFDLYQFNQAADMEWENWKSQENNGDHYHFDLTNGRGYLYANSRNDTLTFTGVPYSGNGEIRLTRTEGVEFPGMNLVGNPFPVTAYIDYDYYTMNDSATALVPVNFDGIKSIEAMEGIFVEAEHDGDTLTFTTTAPENTGKGLVLNLSQGRGIVDRAIVRFGEGRKLHKFTLNENCTKMYIPQEGEDFAVVRSRNAGEVTVSFEPAEDGIYSISVDAENLVVRSLILTDKVERVDIDMLRTPSYQFKAATTDPADRFVLSYKTGTNQFKELFMANEKSSDFGNFNNGSWMIDNEGEATLQVIDMNGRVLSSETINGNASIHVDVAPGVYMLRLINGETVKVQKMVVE